MLALLLGALLASVPAPADDLDQCLRKTPSLSDPPIKWGDGIQRMWTGSPPVPLDSVRASLSSVRAGQQCLLSLDPSDVERPYLRELLSTYYMEAALLASLRRFSEAFATFKAAHAHLTPASPIPAEQETRTKWPPLLHRNKGALHYYLGNLSSAIDQYLRAFRKTPKESASTRATHLMDLGILHQRTQDYRSARRYFNRANRLLRQDKSSVDSSKRARLSFLRADFLLEKTLNTEVNPEPLRRARKLAAQSRARFRAGTKRYAESTLALSEALGYLGHYERAYALNEEARQYARTREAPRLRAFSLYKLGVLHMQTKRWAAADSVLTQSLEMARELRDLDYQRRILRALGRLHELQEQWGAAERFYRKGVDVIETYRESLTATQWSSTAFAQWRDVHRGLARTLLAQDRPRAALTALDRSRARYLQDLRTQARVSNQLPPNARVRLDSLTRALSNVRSRLGKGSLSEATEATLRTREAALMTARRELLQVDSGMASRPPIEKVTADLAREDRVLVSYFLDDPWSIYDRSPRSAAFVLTPDTLLALPLPGLTQDSVQAQVDNISPLFARRGKPTGINAMHFDLRPLRQLYDQLYAPVAEYLSPDQPLTVIPDGPMFRVPFSMLVSAAPGGRYGHARARYVLHERPTTLELATSMTADTSASPFDPSRYTPDLAAFGVSEFDTLQTIPSALRSTLPTSVADSSLALPPLPGVRTEMNVVDRLVSDGTVFLDEAATESAFTSMARHAGVLHLASHAFVHPSAPLQNAFLLHPDSTSDGILFLHELQFRDRPIPLAVLSGCSTARGTLRGGEGMAGLQYAFRAMGARATLSSLWPVSDQASVALMKNFYRALRAGLSKDRALRRAKLTYLEDHPKKASPFFWASTVLYGSPQPVPLDSGSGSAAWGWWYVLLGLAGLSAGALFWFARANRRSRASTSS